MIQLPFDQLSFGLQLWGYGLLGGIAILLALLIVAQWPELKAFARELFTDPVRADDAFVCPRGRDEERRTLSALTESSPRRLVVKQ